MAGAIIGAVVGGSAFAAGSAFFGTTFLASAFTGASLGNMWDQHEAAKKQQAEMEQARQDSLKLGSSNTKQADTPIGLVYGTCRVAGNIVYDSALGTSGVKDMTWIVSLGEGEISSVSSVKLNDKEVAAYPGCSYSFHAGTLAQAADGRYPSENFSNTAFLALTLHASDDLTGTPTVTSIVNGLKILVWNKTSKSLVRKFSRNPAWVLYDVMTNIRYGAGIDPKRIDLDTFIECADYCDYMIDNGSGTMEPRFVFDAVINEIQDAEQLMASIAASFRAFLVCIEGKYKLRIEKAELPTQSFEEGNTIVQGSMAINRASRIDGNCPNRIVVQYIDPVHWVTDEYTLDDDEDIALRGISDKTLSFIGIVRPTQAARTANYIRDMMNLCPNFMEFKVPFEKIECEPGDVIKVTHSLGGYKDKLARVLTIELDEEFQLKLMCREYNAEVYSDDPNKYQVTSTSSFNGTPLTPPNVNALIAVETGYMTKDGVHVSDVNVYWEPMIYPSLKYYELYYQYEGSEAWILNSYTQGSGSVIRNANTNKKMRVKVVTVSEWNRRSSGTATDYFEIVGKDAPPNDVIAFILQQVGENIEFNIVPPSDNDIKCFELRYGITWDNSITLGQFNNTKIILPAPKEGTLSYWVKTIDNSGSYSKNATRGIINVTGLPKRNIILSVDEDMNNVVSTNMTHTSNGWCITYAKRVGEFDLFFDMFGGGAKLLSGAELQLPPIDLGINSIVDGDIVKLSNGETILLETNKIGDFGLFCDMFGAILNYNVVSFATQTYLNVEVDAEHSNVCRVDVYYKTSIDGITYSDWYSDYNKQFHGRFVIIKLVPISTDGVSTIMIKGCKVTVDVPDISDIVTNRALNIGVNTVEFNKRFSVPPVNKYGSVSAFTQDINSVSCPNKITNITKAGFDIEIFDADGNSIAGTLVRTDIGGY